MRAHVGDRLVIEGVRPHSKRRIGIITGAGRVDGLPPYRVYWPDSGYTTLLFPGLKARIEPVTTGPDARGIAGARGGPTPAES